MVALKGRVSVSTAIVVASLVTYALGENIFGAVSEYG